MLLQPSNARAREMMLLRSRWRRWSEHTTVSSSGCQPYLPCQSRHDSCVCAHSGGGGGRQSAPAAPQPPLHDAATAVSGGCLRHADSTGGALDCTPALLTVPAVHAHGINLKPLQQRLAWTDTHTHCCCCSHERGHMEACGRLGGAALRHLPLPHAAAVQGAPR